MRAKTRKHRLLIARGSADLAGVRVAALEEAFDVTWVADGRGMLAAATKSSPELILLPVHLRERDGCELCRQLKGDDATRAIPVVMVAASATDAGEARAFEAGADDVVVAPQSADGLVARLRTRLIRHRDWQAVCAERDHALAALQRQCETARTHEKLTHMLVHDLRSPLTGVSGNLELALRHRDAPAGVAADHIRAALENVTALSAMVSSLIDLREYASGRMHLRPVVADVRLTIQDAVRLLGALTCNRNVCVSLPAEPLMGEYDPSVIGRVVQNLLANALKYASHGTAIRLEAVRAGGAVRISVTDDGPGISPAQLDGLFDHFETGCSTQDKRPTCGIGLAFCRLAVEAHGGTMRVEGGADRGTTFAVSLPVSTGPRTAPTARSASGRRKPRRSTGLHPSAVARRGMQVLVVDRDLMAATAFARYLEKRTAWSITLLGEHSRAMGAARDLLPGLVIIDADLPGNTAVRSALELATLPSMAQAPLVFLSSASAGGPQAAPHTDGTGIPTVSRGWPHDRLLDHIVELMEQKAPAAQ